MFSLRDRNAPSLAALALAVVLLSQRAGADLDPHAERARAATPHRVTCAAVAVFAVEGELECLPQLPALDRSATGAALEPMLTRAPVQRDSVDYRALMGELVVTRDLAIPGLTGVGVRMIPSRRAAVGSPVPVVLIPRFVGTSWYGAEVVATF